MNSSWVDAEAGAFIATHGAAWGQEIALLTYATRLVGSRPDLALHGGGNTSWKGTVTTVAGDEVAALFVKASGIAMETITPPGFVCLDRAYLKKLRAVPSLTDEIMADEFRLHLLKPSDRLPSIETLMHAFIGANAVVHTHPTAMLTLTNRAGGEKTVVEALGGDVGVVPYVDAGLPLGRAVADRLDERPDLRAIVVMHHGLVTWGTDPKQAYDRTIDIVTRAEAYLNAARRRIFSVNAVTDRETARARYRRIAPLIRGLLSPPSGDPDNPLKKMLLLPLLSDETRKILALPRAQEFACTAPLTPDYLVRTKAYPLWVENPAYDDPELLHRQIAGAIDAFSARYDDYIRRYSPRLPGLKLPAASCGESSILERNDIRRLCSLTPRQDAGSALAGGFDAAGFDLLPRVVLLPGLGAICAGPDIGAARIARDITEQALTVKQSISETDGIYLGPAEEHLFAMEFRAFQRAKVADTGQMPLRGSVAVVTGAAGAIGSGICDLLLRQGCAVAATDLPGGHLDSLALGLKGIHGERVIGVPLDVTDGDSVAAAFAETIEAFGGIDIVVINAGLAHVSPLTEMNLDQFRRLESVNIEGTLLMLAQAGKLFRLQNTGGDVVLISTKNVFAPGASFGAYSATKAAAHQLCRIASIEFAEMGVRVNMVAPDAVFSHGATKSGLWAKVGPDRMKARGLDEKGLEEYYRGRNLLKARVTAEHVARAVSFFATRQTPTTGATIPVDGGLPDATPR